MLRDWKEKALWAGGGAAIGAFALNWWAKNVVGPSVAKAMSTTKTSGTDTMNTAPRLLIGKRYELFLKLKRPLSSQRLQAVLSALGLQVQGMSLVPSVGALKPIPKGAKLPPKKKPPVPPTSSVHRPLLAAVKKVSPGATGTPTRPMPIVKRPVLKRPVLTLTPGVPAPGTPVAQIPGAPAAPIATTPVAPFPPNVVSPAPGGGGGGGGGGGTLSSSYDDDSTNDDTSVSEDDAGDGDGDYDDGSDGSTDPGGMDFSAYNADTLDVPDPENLDASQYGDQAFANANYGANEDELDASYVTESDLSVDDTEEGGAPEMSGWGSTMQASGMRVWPRTRTSGAGGGQVWHLVVTAVKPALLQDTDTATWMRAKAL